MIELSRAIGGKMDLIERVTIQFDPSNIQDHIDYFNASRTMGCVMETQNFHDSVWTVYNVTDQYKLNFEFGELERKRISLNPSIALTANEIILALKCYVGTRLRYTEVPNLQRTLKQLKQAIIESNCFFEDSYDDFEVYFNNLSHHMYEYFLSVLDFADFLGFELDENYENLITIAVERNYMIKKETLKNRSLPSFETVFMLNDYIKDSIENMDDYNFEKYFPTLFWWELSTVIPIRTTELTLTVKDCLGTKNGKPTLKVSRTKLKGIRGIEKRKILVSNFHSAYYIQELIINDSFKKLIERYISLTETVEPDRMFLLSKKSYRNLNMGYQPRFDTKCNSYITSVNLRKNVQGFYDNIIHKQYGVGLIDSDSDDYTNGALLKCMDTRHFAIMNMVLMGYEPATIMELSGHTDITSSYNYYAHVEEYISCYTISLCKNVALNKHRDKSQLILDVNFKNIEANVRNRHLAKLAVLNKDYIPVTNGYCMYTKNDHVPCIKHNGLHARCEYFIDATTENTETINELNEIDRRIEVQAKTLRQLVTTRRKMENFQEVYGVTINQILREANVKAGILSNYVITEV